MRARITSATISMSETLRDARCGLRGAGCERGDEGWGMGEAGCGVGGGGAGAGLYALWEVEWKHAWHAPARFASSFWRR